MNKKIKSIGYILLSAGIAVFLYIILHEFGHTIVMLADVWISRQNGIKIRQLILDKGIYFCRIKVVVKYLIYNTVLKKLKTKNKEENL